MAFTGLAADPITRGYFNGTVPAGSTNFLAPANAAQLANLKNQLYRYFVAGLHCRAAAAIFTYAPTGGATLAATHAGMMIGNEAESQFGKIVGLSAAWYGVPFSVLPTPPATSENAYFAGVFAQFGRGATNPNMICSAADCPPAAALYEIWTTSGTANTFVVNGTTNGMLTVNPGDFVHWNLGGIHNVAQVADATATTALAGGWASGAAPGAPGGTFTQQFTTPGMTYYFVCIPHASQGMRGSIHVTGTVPVPPSSASTASISFAAVAVIALAAAKLF
jgi:plastocyanin